MKEKALVEAALFVSQEPLSIKAIGRILGTRSKKKIAQIMKELKEDFEKNNRGLQLVFVGQGYELRVRNEFTEKVAPFAPYTDLSRGMTRSLALIAANNPITQSELVKMQGNKVYDYVRKLEKKGLIKSKKFGRTKLLSPTKNFETYFGRSLEEIREKLKEVITKAQSKAIAPEEIE